jgi:glycosyltransferase involved in cell wall biosynthesis
MLSADRLLFTSQFHLDDFLNALPEFLQHYPEDTEFDAVEVIRSKSVVLSPGLDLLRFDAQPDLRSQNKRPVIVWNQRWQFDRNPAMFFRVMNRLFDIDLPFELILAGDSEHEKPAEFTKALERFGEYITHIGYVEDFDRYSELLHKGDIVVSTATYEFFCVSIMEAIYSGCHPLLPNRLHYPELIPKALHKPLLHAPVIYDSEDDLFRSLRDLLQGVTKPLPKTSLQSVNKHLDWSVMIQRYDDLFDQIAMDTPRSGV